MVEKLKKHKKKLITCGIILVVAVIAIFTIRSNMQKRRQEMMQAMNQTETAAIEKRTLVSSVSATGSIVSAESKEISVSLSNVEVENVNVKVGDLVNEGDVLCTFDSTDIEESLAEAKASLNVTTTKTQMDIAASERGLAEAVEGGAIEESRINDDVADALSDYEEALNDLEDAEDAYEDAEDDADDYKDKLESLNKQKTGLENEKNSYAAAFENAKQSIITYVENKNTATQISEETENQEDPNGVDNPEEIDAQDDSGDSDDSTTDNKNYEVTDEFKELSISSDSIPEDAAGVCSDLGGDETINQHLQAMKEAQSGYNSKTAEISSLDSKIASVQKEYESAKQTENSLESAYEQASSSADSKYDAYEQKVRSQEDTVRNNESTIANKTDSVATSKLNATTSGTNDKNQVEQYEEQLEDCTVTSPISGVITALNIEAGDNYSGTAIATIEDISSYKITTEIDEYDIVDIKAGQKVVIKTNGTGDLELDGTVETVAPRATSTTGNSSDVTYTVTITVDTPCDDLKLDMTAKLSIILESKENVLTVPYNAVQEDEEGNNYIEIVDSQVSASSDSEEKIPAEQEQPDGEMPKMPEGGNMPQMPANAPGGNRKDMPDVNSIESTRIYITKGIESDYYIEVISDEITEGMQVIVPKTEDTQSIQNMMMRQGPMGGF